MELDTVAGGGIAGLVSAAGLFVGLSAAWARLVQPLRDEIANIRADADRLRAEIAVIKSEAADAQLRLATAEERGTFVKQRLDSVDSKLDKLLEIFHARSTR